MHLEFLFIWLELDELNLVHWSATDGQMEPGLFAWLLLKVLTKSWLCLACMQA